MWRTMVIAGVTLGTQMDGGCTRRLDQAPMDHPLRTLSRPLDSAIPPDTRVECTKGATTELVPFTSKQCTKRTTEVHHYAPCVVQSVPKCPYTTK